MHIGLSITPFGHHPAAWRLHNPAGAIEFHRLAAQVKRAEVSQFDFAFVADRLAQRPIDDLSPQALPFEPTTLAAALATVVPDIGLVATAATTQHEPYNLARRFASLDTISKGRAGWNVVVSPEAPGRDEEYLDVVSGLWDSWEDDAFVYDKSAGRFFVPEKMHVLHHSGPHFTVRGPLNVNRSPQGKPVISHVLTDSTLEIAARSAELIFVAASSLDGAIMVASSVRAKLEQYGRVPSHVRILANIIPYTGATSAEARKLHARLNSLSAAVENPAGIEIIESPAGIADRMQAGFDMGLDGYTILPPLLPEGLDAFVDLVVPELRKRSLLRDPGEGRTLREYLGLERPSHPSSHVEVVSR